jgi:hypothetical protein
MKQHVWDMSPDVPSLYIFSPPHVNRAASALLELAREITDDAEADRRIDEARIEQFDKQKWDFVVLAASNFGMR